MALPTLSRSTARPPLRSVIGSTSWHPGRLCVRDLGSHLCPPRLRSPSTRRVRREPRRPHAPTAGLPTGPDRRVELTLAAALPVRGIPRHGPDHGRVAPDAHLDQCRDLRGPGAGWPGSAAGRSACRSRSISGGSPSRRSRTSRRHSTRSDLMRSASLPPFVAAAVLTVGAAIAFTYVWQFADVAYGAVIVWAYIGIAVKAGWHDAGAARRADRRLRGRRPGLDDPGTRSETCVVEDGRGPRHRGRGHARP